MPKPTTEPPAVIRISDNTIIDGKFYVRGTPLPYATVAAMPEILKPLVVTGEPEEDEEPAGARGAFQTNTLYEVTDDNRLGRAVRRRAERQIAALEDENARADWIEEEVNSAELPPEVAAELQDAHDSHVELQRAQAKADAARSDAASDVAAAALEPPQLYVRRGSRHYAPALSARLKAGESVFTRNPEGRFEYVGIVNGDGELPDLPITL
jgi:hypothetical protein